MHSESEHLQNESSTPVDPVPAKCAQCGHRPHTGEICYEKVEDTLGQGPATFCYCRFGFQSIEELGGILGTKIDTPNPRDVELDG